MLHCGSIVSDYTLSGPQDARIWRGEIADDTISCVDVYRNTIAIGTLSGNILFSDLHLLGARYKAMVHKTVGRTDDSAHFAPANALKYSPCGEYLAMGTIKGDVMVLQVSNGSLNGALRILYLDCPHPGGSILNLAWSFDSHRLYSCCTLGLLHEHENRSISSSWQIFSFAASVLGTSQDRVIGSFSQPITQLGCTYFTTPNGTQKTDVICVSVSDGVYLCYSLRNQNTTPWKSALIPGVCGHSLLFNSMLRYRFKANVSEKNGRNVLAPCTELLLSHAHIKDDTFSGCGVECSNVSIYDCKTALKLKDETLYQSVYSTSASRLAHSNKVKLRDDHDITAFYEIVPMQADDGLSIFFCVTVGHRLAILNLKGGCFNVVDLFKYVHKVIVSGSDVYILHSSSASGVMLVDLIRIMFVDVTSNHVKFPLYSYRLHAAVVNLQRSAKRKIASIKLKRKTFVASSKVNRNSAKSVVSEPEITVRKADELTATSIPPNSPLTSALVTGTFRVDNCSPPQDLQDIDVISNEKNLSEMPESEDNDIPFMKESGGTWLEFWRDEAILSNSCSDLPSKWANGLDSPFHREGSRPEGVDSGDSRKSSWLQNAYSSGTYLLSVPYSGTVSPGPGVVGKTEKWNKVLPMSSKNDDTLPPEASSVKERISTKRRFNREKQISSVVSRQSRLVAKAVRFPDCNVPPITNQLHPDFVDEIDEFIAKEHNRHNNTQTALGRNIAGQHDSQDVIMGGMVDNLYTFCTEDYERRTYTVRLPLYPSCGTGIKFDLLQDGELVVIDFVSSVKQRGLIYPALLI